MITPQWQWAHLVSRSWVLTTLPTKKTPGVLSKVVESRAGAGRVSLDHLVPEVECAQTMTGTDGSLKELPLVKRRTI